MNIELAKLVMGDGDSYTLLGNRVLLELDEKKDTFEINGKKSSIIIPDKFKRYVYSGIIRAIGKEVKNEHYEYKIGDKVLFSSTLKGLNLTINDKEYKVIAPYDIEAVVEAVVENVIIKPILDRVLIKVIEKVAKSNIIIPDTAKQDTCEGVVVAVGSGILNENGERVGLDVNIGDSVYYSRFSGMNVPIEGVNHILIQESSIFFKFSKGG